MDIFKIHEEVINDYSNYANSFIEIADERIKKFANDNLTGKGLNTDPLIQFNPSFKAGESLEELSKTISLNSKLIPTFGKYTLHKHQVDALKLGLDGKDFIVTSGTGSGKSLTFLGTVFNHIFNQPTSPSGIVALLVYPMNALINSQTNEINKFKENYEKSTDKKFPISYRQYTGQEKAEEREEIKNHPPHILLTNYMMLELILTRINEHSIKSSIANNLKYLVFDELHTYRGRQGSDVAMLIRRIHSLSKNPLTCIGTSATMISGDSIKSQKEEVAKIASKIFGKTFEHTQVINEQLIKSLSNDSYIIDRIALLSEIKSINNYLGNYSKFKDTILAKWIEQEIGLEIKEEQYVRRKPLTIKDISKQLSDYINYDEKICANKIQELLSWCNELNNNLALGNKPLLPFRIHQFISPVGSIYVTLENKNDRTIMREAMSFIIDNDKKQPIFPIVFSRITGYEFLCVKKNLSSKRFEPREFNQRLAEEDQDSFYIGYLLIDEDSDEIWDSSEISNFPDSWLKKSRNGEVSLKNEYKQRVPQRIYFNKYGDYSDKENSYENKGWFLSAPLLFDPTSETFYDPKTSEGTKLSKLGAEGRSTSTTVLAFSIIKTLANEKIDIAEQKLLSFTDNRQDAALQSGHFNDFIKIGKIRSAIYHAINNSETKSLDYSNIANEVFKQLNLPQKEYSIQSAEFEFQTKHNEEAFKKYLMYRILYDLKKGWRVVLPNLEQSALLRIDYNHLKEVINTKTFWADLEIINSMEENVLHDFLIQVLDFFRKNYALFYSGLEDSAIDTSINIIKEKIKPEWGLDKDESIDKPYFMRVETLRANNQKIYTVSLGPQSYFGKYIKTLAKKNEVDLSNKEVYSDFVNRLLDKLVRANFLISKEINNNGIPIRLYKLKVDSILWCLGDGITVVSDNIRLLSFKKITPKVNKYFQRFYLQDFTKIENLEAREHTAQINNEERKIREQKFKDGELSLLCCSPTMELGVDISTLNVVHMRNVPPNPSNYAQRSGRAGRSGQAALILTFCSNYSPHDQHYFRNQVQMVSGVVSPPKIDLLNEELLKSHLNANYFAEIGIADLNESIAKLIDLDNPDKLNLKEEIKEKLILSDERKNKVADDFKKVLCDFEEKLKSQIWFSDDWINRQLENAAESFDRSLDRWREMYRTAIRLRDKAQSTINNPVLISSAIEKKQALIDQKQALIQIDILCNDINAKGQFSEFYPYRYLASEGFLPGYNFTRLPLRVFLPKGDNGEFISRPRFLGLREFGPGNIIYHDGGKYKISQLLVNDAENNLKKLKVNKSNGYAIMHDDFNLEFCPFSKTPLTNDMNRIIFTDLLQMTDNRTVAIERITCEEEDRLSLGYDIKTYFTIEGSHERIKTAFVKDDKDELLKLQFIPAVTLIKINEKWKSRKEPGFLINSKTGFWKRENQNGQIENIKRVRLITTDTSDAIYIHPMKALSFKSGSESAGIITLQFAIKRSMENIFQVESNEIGVEIMGDPEWPNIMIYEASEGSLGILSQVVEKIDLFKEIIKEAYRICYFENGEDTHPEIGPATYGDLLSYYNQFYHMIIDRHLIKEPLERLLECSIELQTNSNFESYDNQYEHLQERIDINSSTEKKFLKYLYKNNIKLPDKAQFDVPGIYANADFYYEKGNVCIFCDGTPHDSEDCKAEDKRKREAMLNKGYDVVVYYYKDSLDELIAKRSDIFTKVR